VRLCPPFICFPGLALLTLLALGLALPGFKDSEEELTSGLK
jgi:hypothetical protein